MKKIISNITIFLLLLILSGCNLDLNFDENISSPILNKAPIEGKWTISKCIFTEKYTGDKFKYKNLIGKDSIFSTKGAIIANSYVKDPNYKVRRVETNSFLKKKYDLLQKDLSMNTDSLYVIDIFGNQEFFCQVLRETEDVAYVEMNGVFIQILRTSDSVTEEDIESLLTLEGKTKNGEGLEVYNYSENAFVLGLSTPYLDELQNLPNWSYQTFFFKFVEDSVESVIQKDSLLLPKSDGLYQINVERKKEEGQYTDYIIWDKEKNKKKENETEELDKDYFEEGSLQNIKYVSPEYINLESTELKDEKRVLRLNRLNVLKSKNSLTLSDLIENGKEVFLETAKLNLPPKQNAMIDEQNIGFTHDKGFWRLVGRLNYETNEEQNIKDFEIKTNISKDIVKNNDLPIPFSEIKEQLPTITDAFSTPNDRFIITLEENYLKVYNIKEGKINLIPEYEVYMDDLRTPVMAEWTIGRNVDVWQRYFEEEAY